MDESVNIKIDERIARQKALNEERNPRVTIYGEATQRLNPLTNRVYEDQFFLYPAHLSLFELYYDKIESNENKFGRFHSCKPQTNDFIEYQLTLARMDVREGVMSEAQFREVYGHIQKMVKRMNDANVPLDMLSSVRALNSGIRQIQNEIPQINSGLLTFYRKDEEDKEYLNKKYNKYLEYSSIRV